jgi:hypothetical protein
MNAKQRKTWGHREWIRIKRRLAVKGRRRDKEFARLADLVSRAEALLAKHRASSK